MDEHLQETLRSEVTNIDQSSTVESSESAKSRTFSHSSQARSPVQRHPSTGQMDSGGNFVNIVTPSHSQMAHSPSIRDASDTVSRTFSHRSMTSNQSHQLQLQEIELPNNTFQPTPVMPLFTGDSYARAAFTIPNDFIQFLFDETQFNTQPDHGAQVGSLTDYAYINNEYAQNPNDFRETHFPSSQLNTFLMSYEADSTTRSLSTEKSEEILDFIRLRLVGVGDGAVSNMRLGNSLLEGDCTHDRHILSRKMMQHHIDCYWKSFHTHFPILHWPSFSPNTAPIILLLSIMIIGASCSVDSDEPAVTATAAEFSMVTAWYLRWEIFRSMHMESDSLWIYQALIHLEIYEKTYSTRSLHERAHIHHAATITMIRRGSFLAGKSPLDSPPSYNEQMVGILDGDLLGRFADVWWEEWIERESTRRLAFAAFMIDSLHASMFGHSMIMVAHELRLTLPCDDALWSATNGNDARSIEASLRANGRSPIPFREGLRKTFSGQEFHTNAFGRSILLCGVLSVSWYMHQRDIQLSSLDISSHQSEVGPHWRRSIARALDIWRDSHNPSIRTPSEEMWPTSSSVLGSRLTLYHLAQFSLNLDIVECQIFAGANRVLGRVIGVQEVDNVQHKIRKVWAPSAEARKAAFYAMRFLCLALRETSNGTRHCSRESVARYATSTSMLPVHRWVLYSAALIVWSYTYAIDGPSHMRISAGTTLDDHIQEMDNFLGRVEIIKSPEDVAFYRLNSCAGMLHVLCYIFRTATWDLLLESADLLANCIRLIEYKG